MSTHSASVASGRGAGMPHLVGDPSPDARAEPEHDASGRDAGERRGLHRDQRRVARERIDHGRADGDARGHRGGGAGEREGARLEIVLDEPEAVEAGGLGGAGALDDAGGGVLARETPRRGYAPSPRP